MNATEADLLVAGAGAAGLAAALSAAERGKRVVVVEARETFRTGSNTSMSTSMIPAGGSRWQNDLGIEDSPDLFYEDVMAKTRGTADPVVAAALTQVAPDLVGWLNDECGVPLELVTDFRYPGHSRDRCHAVGDRAGRTLHRHLLEAAGRRDEITMIVPMRLIGVDTTEGRVTAARVERPSGLEEEISTTSVVLATNGFGAHPELVKEHIPEIADALYFGGDGSTGDALVIGSSVEADVGYLDAYQGHGSVATPHGILVTWAAVMHGGVLVNSSGERFGDETVGYSEYALPVLSQPGGVAWVILDERIDQACRVFKDYRDLIDAKAVRWANDATALAEIIGADPDSLGKTIERSRTAANGATADSLGRDFWEQPLEAPFGAAQVTGALFHTQGGLKVDGRATVLSAGRPINGLYAAGGAAAGMSGHGAEGYLAGNGLLSALGLGYIAGRAVS